MMLSFLGTVGVPASPHPTILSLGLIEIAFNFTLQEHGKLKGYMMAVIIKQKPISYCLKLGLKKKMIMTCCLMIYAALEHKIRQELKAQNLHFPDMKKKPTQRPTARWVFFCFQGIHVLSIDDNQRHVTNLQDRHRVILKCLGDIYLQIYS